MIFRSCVFMVFCRITQGHLRAESKGSAFGSFPSASGSESIGMSTTDRTPNRTSTSVVNETRPRSTTKEEAANLDEEAWLDHDGDLTKSSWPMSEAKVSGAIHATAFMTMCILDNSTIKSVQAVLSGKYLGPEGLEDNLARCLNSVCSLRKTAAVKNADVIVLVNELADVRLRPQLEAEGVFVERVPPIVWNDRNLRKLSKPERLYSFYKFHAWRFQQFRTIFWFDSDVYFLADPNEIIEKYGTEPQVFTAANLTSVVTPPGWRKDDLYVNSGVMLFKPSFHVYTLLVKKWLSGSYKEWKGSPTEQDVICFAIPEILGPLQKLGTCYNYRRTEEQRQHCNTRDLVLVHGQLLRGYFDNKTCHHKQKKNVVQALAESSWSGF